MTDQTPADLRSEDETTVAQPIDAGPISDEELTELALSADPDEELGADAIPLSLRAGEYFELLPHWYMPPVLSNGGSRRKKAVVLVLVATLLTIEALGLCSVFGQVVIG
jgi:hypothetical protein